MSPEYYGDDGPPRHSGHDKSGDWLKEAITAGMELLDVDETLQQIATHVTTKGEWERAVVSPSLVATVCQLARLKKYLGHAPIPGQPVHMASASARPSAISLVNMTRGFLAEGLLVSALKAAMPDRIIAGAPTYAPRWQDPQTRIVYTGHPDVLLLNDNGEAELVQMKCPSVRKFERVQKLGDDDALETYRAQMVTEMFISRADPGGWIPQPATGPRNIGMSHFPIRNNLILFCWEHTGKDVKPRLHVVPLDWDDTMETIPLAMGDEIEADVARALGLGEWPEAYPEHAWNLWPCNYCPYSRLGDYTDVDNVIPKCDDHPRWEGK